MHTFNTSNYLHVNYLKKFFQFNKLQTIISISKNLTNKKNLKQCIKENSTARHAFCLAAVDKLVT